MEEKPLLSSNTSFTSSNEHKNKSSPTIIIKFSKDVSSLAVGWLEKRITDPLSKGGCDLKIERYVEQQSVVFFISATQKRLVEGADDIGIRKKYKDGSLRDFCVADRFNFKNYKEGSFFYDCERQRIITQSLENLRADDEVSVPGHSDVRLYSGKCILHRMLTKNLITDYFPLHDLSVLEDLKTKMYRNFTNVMAICLEDIQAYYGDSIAIYFAFLNYYLSALVWIVLMGIFHWIFVGVWDDNSYANSVDDNWMVSVMHLCWSVCLLEAWNFESVQYAFKWGSLGMKTVEKPRMAYRGKLGTNEVTGQLEPQYPKWKHNCRVYLISMPLVILCVSFAVVTMFYYFSWEMFVMGLYKGDSSYTALVITTLPSVVYSLIIQVANYYYHQFAEILTTSENHKYEKSYQNALILKILLFDFVNNFLVLYYIAFIYRDMAMLRTTLRNLFLTDIAINQIVECVLPFFNFKIRTYSINNTRSFQSKVPTELNRGKSLTRLEQTRLESQKDTYESTFEDYLELWLQFGYVMLFACAYPPAAFFAIINNLVEQRTDSFKLCNFYRRPFARQCDGIGAWQTAFEVLSCLAIISNLALIFLSPRFLINFRSFYPDGTTVHIIIAFIIVEHILLLSRFLLHHCLPSAPHWVKLEMEKYQYRTRQLLKRESTIVGLSSAHSVATNFQPASELTLKVLSETSESQNSDSDEDAVDFSTESSLRLRATSSRLHDH